MSNARTSPGRVGAGESAPRKQGRSLAVLGYTKPQTYEELRAVLSSGTVHFPKRLRQVAIFLWQHPSAVALGTIAQVADQAGVQPSTLVRFAQIFGYAGFSDFQGLFKDHMKGSWPDGRGQGSHEPAKERSANLHFLHGMVGASQASLSRIGSKRAFPVTTYVSLTLSQQGVRNVLVDNVGSTAFDQVGCISRRDAVLAVSFSPYNSITPDLVAVAHERGASIVAI
ncbi:MAG: MurR/RpiR family transcriptional regulator, partial [Mesorhizobium sp.]